MKIYIVTCGSYSDYHIEKVFTDRKKAEEYQKWCLDANEIEEYDTEDDCTINKYYKIIVTYIKHDNERSTEQPSVRVERCNSKCLGYVHVSDYHDRYYPNQYTVVTLVRYVSEANWNEEFYTTRYTKAAYDLMAQTKLLLSEGWTDRQINEMWHQKLRD
ncbi:MAG: hypothetical protein UH850_14910 [Paludibacteraceae bacterium]|nr:hypothetical protein [Paludibacteraceae bacterium]